MDKKTNHKIILKLESKLERIEADINNEHNLNIRLQQKEQIEKTLRRFKHYRRLIILYEKSNWKWFKGSVADVLTFNDLVDYCNESYYDETPLTLITDGVFIAIGGSAIRPYDLREYVYLPSSLVEEDENIATLRKAFKGYGDQFV